MTVTLTRARVPAISEKQRFFLSIEDDLVEFEVPSQCYKDDTTVSGHKQPYAIAVNATLLGIVAYSTIS
jgi:hypothetical protein